MPIGPLGTPLRASQTAPWPGEVAEASRMAWFWLEWDLFRFGQVTQEELEPAKGESEVKLLTTVYSGRLKLHVTKVPKL